jgi:thiol-disulfide isomerase/thioredoxin
MPEAEACRTHQVIGEPVEGFQLLSIDGELISLPTILKGKRGAVVMFWSSVCSHCARYDSFLNGFARHYPELGLAVVASREKERLPHLRATVRERKLTFPILHDVAGKTAAEWFVRQTPRVFLIDSNGALLYRGAIDNYKYPGDPDYVPYLGPAIAEFLAGKTLSRVEVASFGCAVNSVYYKLPKAL